MMNVNYLDAVKTVKHYKAIVENINNMIKESGYKPSYLAESLNLSRTAFYTKRRNSNFSVDEIEQIVSLLSDADDINRIQKIKETERPLTPEENEKFLKRIGYYDTKL